MLSPDLGDDGLLRGEGRVWDDFPSGGRDAEGAPLWISEVDPESVIVLRGDADG